MNVKPANDDHGSKILNEVPGQLRAAAPWLASAALIAIAVAGRLLPHPPNCTPVAATALLAGFLLRRRSVAVCVPLLSMAISDIFVGGYDAGMMVTVYAALALPVVFAPLLAGRFRIVRAGACSVAGAIVFFSATNFAVWALGTMYAHTPAGLVRCYLAALPFLKYTLLGDVCWSVLLFSLYEAVAAITRAASRPEPISCQRLRPQTL